MTRGEIEALIKRVGETAGRTFLQQGNLLPMAHWSGKLGQQVMMSPSAEPFAKELFADFLRDVLELEEATWVAFISEAWIVSVSREEAAQIDWNKGLGEHPQRQEMLIIQFEDLELGVFSALREIIRSGDKVRLGELVIEPQSSEMEGRFVGLLPRKKAVS